MKRSFYVLVTVDGYVQAKNAGEALQVMSERIRQGIGPDPDGGHREGGVTITGGRAYESDTGERS